MIKPEHLLDNVIKSTLKWMEAYTDNPQIDNKSIRQLLFVTTGAETHFGYYLTQQPSGYADSIYQHEPKTVEDAYYRLRLKDNKPVYANLKHALDELYISALTNEQNLIMNFAYATALARVIYYLVPKSLPRFDCRKEMWEYYKKYWNSSKGDTSEAEFFSAWDKMKGFRLDFGD